MFVDFFSEVDSGSDFVVMLDGDKLFDFVLLFEVWGLWLLLGKVFGDGVYVMFISFGWD